MSVTSVQEVLSALRWSINRGGAPMVLALGMTIRLVEDRNSPSLLALVLTFANRQQRRVLAKEHVETRGKSMWFRDNTWRLSEAGCAFFAPSIEAMLADPRMSKVTS